MTRKKALVVYGTRPEAIKMAPVVRALAASTTLEPVVAVTGQHREMLDQVNALFDIVPDHDLDIIQPRQQLHQITSRALDGLTAVVRDERPDVVISQGDTTTAFVAALAAFYEHVPVAHVEAGLRTDDRYNPFPEEINRRLTSQLTTIHLAPTPTSRDNLLREGVAGHDVFVTGNTVIDALLDVIDRRLPLREPALSPLMTATDRHAVLITSHRRESWGEPMACTARAISRLAHRFPEVMFTLPAHLNPAVRDVLLPPLQGLANVTITEPLGYSDFARAMHASSIMLTDSGGVQEEAPSLGKPVLVLRDTTERPEAVDAGTVRLVGTDEDLIVDSVAELLTDETAYKEMAHAVNPYGDGRAAGRIVAAIAHHLGEGDRPDEFVPDAAAR